MEGERRIERRKEKQQEADPGFRLSAWGRRVVGMPRSKECKFSLWDLTFILTPKYRKFSPFFVGNERFLCGPGPLASFAYWKERGMSHECTGKQTPDNN